MFERFTASARDVVLRAVAEAERRDSPRVGVEHVLVALTEVPESAEALRVAGFTAGALETVLADLELAERRGGLGPADAEALRSIGIDLDAVVAGVEERHGEGALAPPQRPHRRPLLRRLLEQLGRVQVRSARNAGWSWQEIAAELGVSRQAVHKKHAGG